MRLRSKLAVCALAVLMSGCAVVERLSGKERVEDEPPLALTDIQESVNIRQHWTYNLGGGTRIGSIQLEPALSNGSLFIASPRGSVIAVDPDSGKSIWRSDIEHPISGAVGAGDDVVLVGTPEGLVVALDALSGSEQWTQQLSSEILAPPAAGLGVSVARTIDGHVYGLNSENGEQQWVFHRQVPSLTLRGDSAPLIVQGAVLAGFANGKIVAANVNSGSILWDITVAEPTGRNEVEQMIDIDATPVIVGSVLYVSAFQGAVTALALGSRRILWSREMSSYTPVSADDNYVFVSDEEGKVIALDRLTGATVWEQAGLLRRRLSGPVSVGDYVLVTDYAGYGHVLRKSDGQIVGRRKLSGGKFLGTAVVHQNKIYTMNQQGNLTAVSLEDS